VPVTLRVAEVLVVANSIEYGGLLATKLKFPLALALKTGYCAFDPTIEIPQSAASQDQDPVTGLPEGGSNTALRRPCGTEWSS